MADEKNKDNEIDSNLIEILKRLDKEPKLTEQEKNKLIEEIKRDFDFEGLIKKIQDIHPLNSNKYVIFTTGKEQLYYEDGEFFVISAIDSKKSRKKLKRKEALDMYNEYFITNILNPLIKQKAQKTKDTQQVLSKEENKNQEVKEVQLEEKATLTQDKNIDDTLQVTNDDNAVVIDKDETNELDKKQKQEDDKQREIELKEKEKDNEIKSNSDIEERLNALKQREEEIKQKNAKSIEVKKVKKKQEKEIEL